MQALKKYLSLFLLLLFLFPLAEKELHALEHADEEHCTASDKHFHELEHNCHVCDFTLAKTDASPEAEFSFLVFSRNFVFRPFIQSVSSPSAFAYLPSRAPPASL